MKSKTDVVTNNPVYAAHLRKRWNREHPTLLYGDTIRMPDGKFGEFRGISTYKTPDKITVLFYEINGKPVNDAIQLEKTFHSGYGEIPVFYSATKRPEGLPEPSRSSILPPKEVNSRHSSW